MKQYLLLGHRFELEPRAYFYLESYVSRIEQYAHHHDISPDILEDITYNIIEKLYTAESPINESFVMNLAETIGESEQIFENKSENEETKKTNLLEKWFGKQKPMIWGVCYWIAKSLKIPVSIVRLIFLIAVFIYGMSIWLYLLLALFVPFQDKKSTTGRTGNLFFEIMRVIIWLGVIFFLGMMIIGAITGIIIFSVIPPLSNQSLQSLVPPYLYSLFILSVISLIVLFIGAVGAILRKSWLPKGFPLIATVIIILSMITAGIAGFVQTSNYNYNSETLDTQVVGTLSTEEQEIVINLSHDKLEPLHYNFGNFNPFFRESYMEAGAFQDIKLLPSERDEVYVEVVDTFNILPKSKIDEILAKRSQVVVTTSGNSIDIVLPSYIFTEKVPFSFAERRINIHVPVDKKITYNNASNARYRTPSQWSIYPAEGARPNRIYYCVDKGSFLFYEEFQEWRCANTTYSNVNKNIYSDTGKILESRSDFNGYEDEEDMIEDMFEGLSLSQAYDLAGAKGWSLRVVEEDGRSLPITADFRAGRINVEVENGIITDVDVE